MVSFRRIKPEEIEEAKRLAKEQLPWSAEPQWNSVYVRMDDDVLTGFVGFQLRTVVEPLYANTPRVANELITWADGFLNTYNQYEFVVPDCNERFQKVLENHFGLEGKRELPGKIYFVKRDK